MIDFKRHTLKNGLRIVVHEDMSSPMVAVSILYDVGSRDEEYDKTGFAHLFEHLMFGGSKNAPDFDEPIQNAGGENNAYTNTDMTNFYTVLPASNIETALWLESDRMKDLIFSQKALDIQKSVVIEEFKETCLTNPYGDVWHHLSDLAYKKHSYQWPTIGKDISHIENATLENVRDFFYKHYTPSNAICVLSGNINTEQGIEMTERWFGDLSSGTKHLRHLPQEPQQTDHRSKTVYGNAPLPAIYMAFKMVDRLHPEYHIYDLISDVLSNGRSSRLFQKLHRDQRLFTQIDAYISGTFDQGLFVIEGRPTSETTMEEAEKAIWTELNLLKEQLISEKELQKLKNKIESSLEYSEVNILHKAMSLGYFELLGNAHMINGEAAAYQKIRSTDIKKIANRLFTKTNCSKLLYLSQ